MKPRPGYKQTLLGVLPDDWAVVPFSEILELRNGVNADKQAYGQGVPFVNVLEIITKAHLRIADICGRVSISKDAAESFALRRGDLVFNRTSETQEEVGLASVYVDDTPAVFGGFVIRGRPTPGALDPLYSGYAFRAPAVRAQIIARGQGAIRANVGQSDLNRVVAPLPPMSEQRAIAEALEHVDALLGALTQLLAKKRDLKQAAMQQLLNGQTRLPGFSGEWQTASIADVASVKTGPFGSSLHESDYVREGTPIVTVEHLGEFGVLHRNLPLVSEADRQRLRAYSLETGDIVFSRVGSIDRNAVIREMENGWLFSGRLLRVRANRQRALGSYLSYQFHGERFKRKVRDVAVGQTMPSLNTQILKRISITVPELPEQAAIAAVLSTMDADLGCLEVRLGKTHDLKQGMMQELLTGRTRLV